MPLGERHIQALQDRDAIGIHQVHPPLATHSVSDKYIRGAVTVKVTNPGHFPICIICTPKPQNPIN